MDKIDEKGEVQMMVPEEGNEMGWLTGVAQTQIPLS